MNPILSEKLPNQRSMMLTEEIKEILGQMGYCAPEWDHFHVDKFNVPLIFSPQLGKHFLSPKQIFVINIWPRVQSFFEEDEDATVLAHARTVKKNGLLTRVFSLNFPNEANSQRWEFIFEKRIDPGIHGIRPGKIKHLWTSQEPSCEYEEILFYTRSFDTHAQSAKFKMNKDRGATTVNKQNFLREVKANIVQVYQSTEIVPQSNDPHVFYKGKEIEFEEAANQITWMMSMRCVSAIDDMSWTVSHTAVSPDVTSRAPSQILVAQNPFEEDVFNEAEENETNRQMVEQKIVEFMDFVWPSIRNFYLEIPEDHITSLAVSLKRNSRPTRMLEFHLDTLNERNRWKFLFEISIGNGGSIREWAKLRPRLSDNFVNVRTYSSYEKRGTSSRFGQDRSDYFQGFYKRWFLTEIQSKLVKSYAQEGFFTITSQNFDQNYYEFGKEVEFSDQGDLMTWSFSAQRICKYPERDVPCHVWSYGLTDSHIPELLKSPFGEGDADSDTELDEKASDASTCDADISQVSAWTTTTSYNQAVVLGKTPSKPKSSKLRTLARSFVRPMTKKSIWLSASSIFRSSKQRDKDYSEDSN